MNIRIKKLAAKIGVGFIILIALALVARAVLNFSSGKKLEGVIQSMKREGVPLTLKEIEPECDPSDNAALSWKAVEALFLVEKEKRDLLNETIQDFFFRRPLSAERKMQLSEIVSKDQKALHLLQEACSKPCFKYEESWDATPSSLKLPDLVKLILMFRLHGVDSYLTAENGQIEEAVEQCLAGMSFLETYLQEPFLMNYLVAVANMKVLLVCLQRITEDFPIDAALMKKIIENLDPGLWRDELLWDFKAERIHAIEAAFSYLDGKLDLDEGKFLDDISIWLFKPYLKSGMANILRAFNEYDEAISIPYFDSRDAWDEITKDFNKPFYKQIMGLLFPNFTVVKFKEATMEAILQSIRLGLGCRIYKEEKGSYPEILSELTPDILSVEPVDPFTGEPFTYRIDDSGLIIYSIGNNLKDDQGRGTWMIDRLVMEKDDDWAWIDTQK